MRVVLASANAGKLRELEALLGPVGWQLVPQAQLGVESVPETGTTFVENALLKARHAARATRLPALADDSGIEVDALGGRPGVRSARYAGEHATDRQNLEKLLAELQGVPPERRTARYRCVIAYVGRVADPAADPAVDPAADPAADPCPILAEGCWEGTIAMAPRGRGGFGYDPIFLPAHGHRTAAELDAGEKDAVSHRAQALSSLRSQLRL